MLTKEAHTKIRKTSTTDISVLSIELLKRLRTTIGIILIVITAYLLLILLGYHPQDPSWANNIPAEQANNPGGIIGCLLYTSPSPRDRTRSRMPSSA